MASPPPQSYPANSPQPPHGGPLSHSPSFAPPPEVALSYLFGVKADVSQSIHFQDQRTLVYPCGHNIVLLNMDDRSQAIIPCIDGTKEITAMALSSSRRYLAVAEDAEIALISVYDVILKKKRKSLATQDCASHMYVSLAFSPVNEKHLLSLSGEPDWLLILWQWDKLRYMAYQKVGTAGPNQLLYQCSFNPLDATSIVVTGNGVFKYYKQAENGLKVAHTQIAKKDMHAAWSQHYTAHAWVNWINNEVRLVVCTDQGEVIILDANGEYKSLLASSPGDGFWIECIVPFSKGFIVGGDNGIMHIFNRNPEDSKLLFKREPHALRVQDSEGIKIRQMAITPQSEYLLVVCMENNQIKKLPLNVDRLQEVNQFDPVVCDFHAREITGLDVCVRKQLVATCSTDKSVRIWNYHNRTLDINEQFPEEAYSVAFHPSGFHLIVGFADKLRLMNVFLNRLKPFKEIPIKICREVQFSHGGHLFAAVNSHTIQVYHFYTGENSQGLTFKGHYGKVRCVSWFEDDFGFASAGLDGSVFEWQLKEKVAGDAGLGLGTLGGASSSQTNKQRDHFNVKGQNFSSVLKANENNLLYVVGSDRYLRAVQGKDEKRRVDAGCPLSQICLMRNQKLLVAGTAEAEKPGKLRAYAFPINGDYQDMQIHSSPVERLRMSFDDCFIFSGGHDGSLAILEIKDKDLQKGAVKYEKETYSIPFAEEILIEKKELDSLNRKITEKNELNKQLEEDIRKKTNELRQAREAELARLKRVLDQNEARSKASYEAIQRQQNMREDQFKSIIEERTHKHEDEMNAREAENRAKQLDDENRYQDLEQQIQEMVEEQKREEEQLKRQQDKILRQLEEEHAIEIEHKKNESLQLESCIEEMINEHQQLRDTIENDAENEIDLVKQQNYEELQRMIQLGMASRSDLSIAQSSYENAETKIEQLHTDIERKNQELETKKQETNNLKQEIQSQESEIKERNRTIQDKNNRIKQLKKKTQELEKFKFVLDYKIKELKRDIAPRQHEIQKLKEQTEKMRQEIAHFKRVNANLGLVVDDLRMRQEGMGKEIEHQQYELSEQTGLISRFKEDVWDACYPLEKKSYKEMKEGIIGLHKKYVLGEMKAVDVDTDNQKEYASTRTYLERTVDSLRRKLQKDCDMHKADNIRLMKENVLLIKDINDLKRDIKMLELEKRQEKMDKYIPPYMLNDQTLKACIAQIDRNKVEMGEIRSQLEALHQERIELQNAIDSF